MFATTTQKPINKYPAKGLAERVGFEPTGLSPQKISSLRRYDHFGTSPHIYWAVIPRICLMTSLPDDAGA